jgi:hypothetical protein
MEPPVTPAPSLSVVRPLPAVVTPRFRMSWLWLLTLLPGDVVVVMDLVHGAFRPGVWLARFSPALLVLALVAWSSLTNSPLAVRLRTELRLALFPALLLLVSSGSGLVLDVVPFDGLLAGLMHAVWALALVLPAAMLLTPMVREYERETLAALLVTPRGARAFGEKFALGAGLVVLSWLQLSPSQPRFSELWYFELAGHVLALATVPTWFLFGKKEGATLGLVVLVPFFAVMPVAWFERPTLVTIALVVYGLGMLALFPRALRRGLLAPGIDERLAVAGVWAPRTLSPLLAAELSAQREALILASVGVFGFFGVLLCDGREGAPMVLFMLSVLTAALSPSLAFAEAQRLGTLEPLLVLRPRREVFRLKVLTSLGLTLVASVVLPLLILLATRGEGRASDAAGWLVAIGFVWSLGLVSSVHSPGAAISFSASLGIAFASAVGLGLAFALTSLGVGTLLGSHAGGVSFLGATFVASMAIAVFLAWRRFVQLPEPSPRAALLGAGVALFHAVVMGAAAAL